MNGGRARPLPALVGACLLAAACTALSNRAEEGVGRTVNGGGELLGLRSTDGTADQRRARPDQFCTAAAAALRGGDVLDCQLVPFGNAASTACPERPRATVREERDPFAEVGRCQPLAPSVATT